MEKKDFIVGDYNELEVIGRSKGQYILSSPEGEIPLVCDTRGADIKIGEILEVFVHTESNGAPIATISTPYAVAGEFACMTVVDSNQFGTYMDWGIEKDLFVFNKEQERPLKLGKRYVVYVKREKLKGKIQGTTFLESHFDQDVSELKYGQEVSMLIYDITQIGIMAVVDSRYSGMLYINECFEKIKIGDIKRGYIKKIREDGKIDLTLRSSYITNVISTSKTIVFKKLKENDGFLPFHDKSDPEEIKKTFSMSKKNFKKAIGALYKEGKVELTADGVYLIKDYKKLDRR